MIFDKFYDLLKYRNLQPPEWLLNRMPFLVHMHDKLVKDSNEGQLDPFLYKVMAAPPKRKS